MIKKIAVAIRNLFTKTSNEKIKYELPEGKPFIYFVP